jgi:aldehyde dehydrogenase (NAD+)
MPSLSAAIQPNHSPSPLELLKTLGVPIVSGNNTLPVHSPVDGSLLGAATLDTPASTETKIARSHHAFEVWRSVPAPKRGELVRLLGEELRQVKETLSLLVTLECGKTLEEARGEVQEMIDICDFAVGLSRQLYGLTIASERSEHVMQESWMPLGSIGVISAFNFPVAVWAWNAALGLVCGDSVVWKPSEKTPLTALACEQIFARTSVRFQRETGHPAPHGLLEVVIGGVEIGELLVNDHRLPLISATGSCRMGAIVGPKVASRFGRSLLELGGNNAVIITPAADLSSALPAMLFGAVATCGQRCTTTRRAFVHESMVDRVIASLTPIYTEALPQKIGDPLESQTLIGPLIDARSFEAMQAALAQAKAEGGTVIAGGKRVLSDRYPGGYYVEPALVRMPSQTPIVLQETFAPILYVMSYQTLEEAMKLHNAAAQGLSSSIFTTDVREAEWFRQHSDCGIVNVNIGTSGAEIGGAFGGEKETGGGRESGSDSWKQYMRRQTSTLYYGKRPPELAQGIRFTL